MLFFGSKKGPVTVAQPGNLLSRAPVCSPFRRDALDTSPPLCVGMWSITSFLLCVKQCLLVGVLSVVYIYHQGLAVGCVSGFLDTSGLLGSGVASFLAFLRRRIWH